MCRDNLTSLDEHLLEIEDLVINRGSRAVLQISNLTINSHEVLSIIGPNGAGKSTLLLALSRLINPEHGSIRFRGKPVSEIDELTYRRRIGLVLQDPLLMDTTVYENVALGLRFRGVAVGDINTLVDSWLNKLGILQLKKRKARSLSGGEAQRVSLARAFVLDPELLLLDEPFSALDAPTRARLLEDFHALITASKTTTVFITHVIDEALLLSSRVAVLFDGKIRQAGTPLEVFSAPNDPEIAAFVGVETIIPGRVIQSVDGIVVIESQEHHLEGVGDFGVGSDVYYCLRPEDVTLLTGKDGTETSARNRVQGIITRMIPSGPLMRIVLDCGFPITSLITRASMVQLKLETGKTVTASFKASAAHIIPS